MKIKFLGFIALTILFFSCKKETAILYDNNKTAPITIKFDNVAGGADVQLGTGNYRNAAGENFKIDLLKYFVSNFKFTRTDGSIYTVPQDSSYFLIDESNASSLAVSMNIPEGEYSKLSFILGIDSVRNTKDISQRTGVLDPSTIAAGMYWSWNSGYIFFKMEGTSPASSQNNNAYKYHIGLYGGMTSPTINNIKTITIDLNNRGTARVKQSYNPQVHLLADVLKVFTGTTNISIANNAVVMASAFSANIANNYQYMFSHDHTHN